MAKHRLNDADLAIAIFNLAQAKASFACEGIVFTPEEEALFERFELERLPHDECRRLIIEFCRDKRHAAIAAE